MLSSDHGTSPVQTLGTELYDMGRDKKSGEEKVWDRVHQQMEFFFHIGTAGPWSEGIEYEREDGALILSFNFCSTTDLTM